MAESWEGEHGYAPKNHDHDDKYSKLGHVHDYAAKNHNHDDRYSLLGHSHELLDMLPIGTVLWFKSNVTLSNKWIVYTDLIGRYPLGSTSNLGNTVEAGLPNIRGTFIAQTPMDGTSTGYSGAFTPNMASHHSINDYGSGLYSRDITFNASASSGVYKDGVTTVTPPSVNLIPYIKIA